MITLSFLFREGEGTRVLGHVGQFGNVGTLPPILKVETNIG